MSELEVLGATGDGIKFIHLKDLPKLRELSDAPATIRTARFEKLPSLSEFDLRSTDLEKLEIVDLPKLKEVKLQGTKLMAPALKSSRALHPTVKFVE